MADEHLRSLIPRWHGRRSDQLIIDGNGKDVSVEVSCDLSFEAEFVLGIFQKIGVAPLREQERGCKLFKQHGIAYVKDMSVILRDELILKVIDFATR